MVHPSSDTVGRDQKELKTDNEIYTSEISGREYKFNTAETLNQLLLRMINHLGLKYKNFTISINRGKNALKIILIYARDLPAEIRFKIKISLILYCLQFSIPLYLILLLND